MWRAAAALLAAVLALTGCKSTDSKSGTDRVPAGTAARTKKDKEKEGIGTKGPGSWLGDVGRLPGAGTGIPGPGKGDPSDPKFDPRTAAQDALGGRVLDPDGKPARNIYVRIEQVGGGSGGAAPMGIYTKPDGYFFATGWEPGKTYELTAIATTQDGRKLSGVVQTKVPNPILLIVLRDDFPPPAKGDGVFPPDPQPSNTVGDKIPATTIPPKSSDGGWGPGGPVTGVPPTSIGGGSTPKEPTGKGEIPPPADFTDPPAGKLPKPENVADGLKDPFKPPSANIPGGSPPMPSLPQLPPSFTNPPPGGRDSMGTPAGNRNAHKVVLIDTMEQEWDLDSVKPGSLVLVEFITSSCGPCKQAIPVMKDIQSRYGAGGLQVAAILCDNLPQKQRVATAAKYSRDYNLNYAMYVEPGAAGSVRDHFDVQGYPHAVLLDAAGKVIWRGHPMEKAKLETAIKQHLGK